MVERPFEVNEHPPYYPRVRALRDWVEIVAIVAAGIWAFYVFVYENQIKPSLADPNLKLTASMRKVSVHDGLAGVLIHVDFENIGTTKIFALGLAMNVRGEHVIPLRSPRPAVPFPADRPISVTQHTFFDVTPGDTVFTLAFLTQLVNPKTQTAFEVDPGAKVNADQVFYVPVNRYDRLTAHIDIAFEKTPSTRPKIQVVARPYGHGLDYGDYDDVFAASEDAATLDMHEP